MKKFLTLLLAVTFISSISFATIRRVGYAGIQLAGVDYGTNLQLAHDESNPGDTIQIYNTGGYGCTAIKSLVYIGFGYNLDVHPNLQVVNTDQPSTVSINFSAGSNGTIVTGLSGGFGIGDVSSGLHTPVSNITFTRCYGSFQLNNNEGYGPVDNIKILSSIVSGGMGWNGPNDFPCTNIQVYNCLIESYAMYKPASSAIFVNCVSSGVFGPLNLTDASVLVKNCIFGYSGYAGNINTVYENNFFIEANPGVAVPGSNNRWGQDYNVLFQRIIPDNGGDVNFGSYTGYGAAFDENYYILKAGSPAINGGFNAANAATNCGIFGGETQFVYKPSGIPSVPAIYKLTAPGLNASANPYNVTISVRSNN